MVWLGYLASVLMGVSLGLIGGGGSILTVPILYYFFGQDSITATTDSLFVVGSTALLGAVTNARNGNIDYRTGILFALPSFLAVYLVRHFLLPALPDPILSVRGIAVSKGLLIMFAFATVMLLAARAMIRRSPPGVPSARADWLSVGIKGFLVGATTGFVGAGGGFLIIPALVILLHLPVKPAIGTSLAIIAANSLFGFVVSTRGAPPDWPLLWTITFLGASGIFIGSRLSRNFSDSSLKRGFGYFVLILGSFMILDQIRLLLHG